MLKSIRILTTAMALMLFATPVVAQWSYSIGQERAEQQAQFCDTEEDALDLARLFRRKGARAGYFGMRQIYDCVTRIATFTPLEVIDRVSLETKTGQFNMNFVRVRMRDGTTRYLVTARDVKEST